MKANEQIYREILESKSRISTQKYLAVKLGLSLSVINGAIKPLREMGALKVKLKGFEIINERKILYYWASVRNFRKDIVYQTRVKKSVSEIEKMMPPDIIYGAYSAFKFFFKSVPADYSEIYIYADDIKEIERRFPKNDNPPNLFVLIKDKNLKKMVLSNIIADLWNLGEWYARDFLIEAEEKWNTGTR